MLDHVGPPALFGIPTVCCCFWGLLAEVYIVVNFWPRTYFLSQSKVLLDGMHWHNDMHHVSQLKVHTYTFAAIFVVAKHCLGMQSTTVLLESVAFSADRGSFPFEVTRNTLWLEVRPETPPYIYQTVGHSTLVQFAFNCQIAIKKTYGAQYQEMEWPRQVSILAIAIRHKINTLYRYIEEGVWFVAVAMQQLTGTLSTRIRLVHHALKTGSILIATGLYMDASIKIVTLCTSKFFLL